MASYILRPNLDWNNASNFVVTPSGSVYTALADSSDTTYITRSSSTVPTFYEAEFGTFTLSANEVVTSVNLRARLTLGTTGYIGFAIGVIKDRNGRTVSYSAQSTKQNTLALGTYDLAFNLPSAPSGEPWSQTLIDNLVVKFIDNAGISADRANLYELYVDVTTTTQPTLAITTPATLSTITTTSFPSINWTYTDAEGDPQNAYRIKIFDSATYGAVGFSPDTSTPTLDTGVVVSGNNGATLTVNLANSTTYRAYVEVAQLVNGANFWSAWAYTQFTMNIDSPASPSISAFYDSTLLATTLTVFGRTNFLTANQASLETDTTGWVLNTNCSIARSTAQFNDGVASLAITATASADAIAKTNGTAFPVTPNIYFSAIASCRTAVTGRAVAVGIRYLDSGGATISTTYGATITDTSAGWTTASASILAPTNAVTAQVFVKITTAGAGEVHYVDNIGFHAGSVPFWTSGGFSTFSFDVERSTDGGTTYTTLRNSPFSASTSQISSVYDYEIPVSATALYRAKARAVKNSLTLSSGYATSAPISVANSLTWTFVAPKNPSIIATGILVKSPLNVQINESVGIFKPLGSSKTVVVATSIYGEDGSYEINVIGEAKWAILKPVITFQGVLQVTDPLGRSKYIRITGRDWTEHGQINNLKRTVKVTYYEVDKP